MKKIILSLVLFMSMSMSVMAADTTPIPTQSQVRALDNKIIESNTTNKTVPATNMGNNNIIGVPNDDLRSGNVDLNTIPYVIVTLIETLIGIAGTIAVFSLIYHAVQMQLKSGITGDSSGVDSAKKGMIGSIIGFIIAILAWFIVTRAAELLGSIG